MTPEEAQEVSLRAAIDQLCRVRQEEAREVGAYYAGLRAQGIPRLVAWVLLRDWHAHRSWAGYNDIEMYD